MGRKLSITAFVFSMLFLIPFCSLIGLILGIIDLVKKDEDSIKWLSIAAIILSCTIGLIIGVVELGLILTFIRAAFAY